MKDKPQTSVDEIIAGLGGTLDDFQPFHNQILVAIWMRPEKTTGGIIMPDKVLEEDRWQGKVGLVLKQGPIAFENDNRNDFKGQDVSPGDWVIFQVSNGFAIDVNGVHCRMLEDIHIKATVASPNIIW